MKLPEVAYIALACLLAWALLRRAENKAFMALVLVWLFGYPILARPEYMIQVNLLGFDLQPNRILFLVLSAAIGLRLLRAVVRPRVPRDRKRPAFELFMLGYMLAVLITVSLNHEVVGGWDRVAVIASGQAVFFLAYYRAKWDVTVVDRKVLYDAVVALGIISTVVGLVQFLWDPTFLRWGDVRPAFGDFMRSTGVFPQEYEQGLLQIIAMVIGLTSSRRWTWSFVVLASASLGVFLTMHRLTWVAFVLVLGSYAALFWIRRPTRVVALIGLSVLAVAVILSVSWEAVIPESFGSAFLYDRVLSDTLTGRFEYYRFAIDLLWRRPWGVGSFYTDLYNQQAYLASVPFQYLSSGVSRAMVVHNGFLAAGSKHGVMGLVLFTLFLVSMLWHFTKRVHRDSSMSSVPFFVVLAFVLLNATNDFSDLNTEVAVVIAIVLGAAESALAHPNPSRAASLTRGSGITWQLSLVTSRVGQALADSRPVPQGWKTQ
jgi:hypothetical protein